MAGITCFKLAAAMQTAVGCCGRANRGSIVLYGLPTDILRAICMQRGRVTVAAETVEFHLATKQLPVAIQR